jgi:hypothetical protein
MKKKLFFILLANVLAINTVFAQLKTFNVTSGAWNVAGNWSPSGVPTSANPVIIPAGRTCNITADITSATSISVNGTLTRVCLKNV